MVITFWWIRDLSFQWSSQADYHYGWLVLLLAVYLAWERWPNRPLDDRPAGWGWTLGCALAGMPWVAISELYRLGVARTPSSSMALSFGCTLFLAGNILALAGPRTLRHFAFPILFLYLAVPVPKILWNPIVFGLQSFVATLNVETLKILGIPAARRAHVIQLPNCVVGVDEACSGIRSLQSSLMAALFIGDLTLRRGEGKVLFLAAGLALAVTGNFFRSLFLSLTAYRNGAEALASVHDTAGWSVLVFTACGVMALGWWIHRAEEALRRNVGPPDGPLPPVGP